MNVRDANSLPEVEAGIQAFLNEKSRPTMIIVDSHIGFGSPNKQDSNKSHGEPLGAEEVKLTKRNYGWPEDGPVPRTGTASTSILPIRSASGAPSCTTPGRRASRAIMRRSPQLATEFDMLQKRETPEAAAAAIPTFPADEKGIADARIGFQGRRTHWAPLYPWLIGGSADLDSSTKTKQTGGGMPAPSRRPTAPAGTCIWRSRTCDGRHLQRHRPVESSALWRDLLHLLRLPASDPSAFGPDGTADDLVFTHDSIGVGEDGPTHQPVEQLPSLRAIPGPVHGTARATPTKPPRPGVSPSARSITR